MRAVVIHGPRDLRHERRPVPEPGPGQILIRTLAASICNATDVHIWEGDVGEELRPPYPHVLGHERCGIVVGVGAGVAGFSAGDRVACWAKMDGAFAEYDLLRPADYPVVKLGDGVSDDAGSLLEFVAATLRALHAARLRPAERVLVLGQGVQGIVLAREARLLGAATVVGVDLIPERVALAGALGGDVAYLLEGRGYDEARADLRDALGGEADLVIDATGSGRWAGGSTLNLGLELLRWGGRCLLYALPTEDIPVNTRLIALRGISLLGIDTPPHEVRPLLTLAVRWAADGRLPLDALITHRVPLERVAEGLALCRDCPDQVLKVMVDMGGPAPS